ncbi:MAG: hypothetical protein DWB56_05405 [Candidatus Jettenia sp.]|nr:hypothetical protein [Candidatus Jettenia sp.]
MGRNFLNNIFLKGIHFAYRYIHDRSAIGDVMKGYGYPVVHRERLHADLSPGTLSIEFMIIRFVSVQLHGAGVLSEAIPRTFHKRLLRENTHRNDTYERVYYDKLS